jgi:hypothetical protein
MPGATANRAYPYPLPADSINVPRDIQALAEKLDTDLANAQRVFANKTALDAWAASPGAIGFTTDLGLLWVRKGTIWVPVQITASGGWQSMGGFPAGEYNWPAADANLAGYMGAEAHKDLMFPAGLTAWLGLWTVECTLQTAPTDGGDYTLKLNMDTVARANTSKAVFGVVNVVAQDVVGAGKQLLWRMYKHANSAGLTSTYIRFVVTFHAAY